MRLKTGVTRLENIRIYLEFGKLSFMSRNCDRINDQRSYQKSINQNQKIYQNERKKVAMKERKPLSKVRNLSRDVPKRPQHSPIRGKAAKVL